MANNPSPGVYTKIIDLSSYLQEIPGSIGFVPFFSKTGEDNTLVYQSSINTFSQKFGSPNINEFGKQYGMGKYIAHRHMSVAPSMYVIRCLPTAGMQNPETGEYYKPATYSNIMIGFSLTTQGAEDINFDGKNWFDAYTNEINGGTFDEEYSSIIDVNKFLSTADVNVDGQEFKISGAVMFANNLYNSDTLASAVGKSYKVEDGAGNESTFYPLFITYPVGRGDEYDKYAIKMYSDSVTDGTYRIEIWKSIPGAGDANTQTYKVSFDKNAVNESGDNIFIEDVLNNYDANIRIVTNETNVDFFLKNIPVKTINTVDVSELKRITVYKEDDEAKNIVAGTCVASCNTASISGSLKFNSVVKISGTTNFNGSFTVKKVVNMSGGAEFHFDYPGFGPTSPTLPDTEIYDSTVPTVVSAVLRIDVQETDDGTDPDLTAGTCTATVASIGQIVVGKKVRFTGTQSFNDKEFTVKKITGSTKVLFNWGTAPYPPTETIPAQTVANILLVPDAVIDLPVAKTDISVEIAKELFNIEETRTYSETMDRESGMPIHLQNGSLGDLLDSTGKINQVLAKQLLIQAYNGVLDEEIKNVDGKYIPLVYNAGYPAEVAAAAVQLQQNFRNDGIVISDIGDNSTVENGLRNRSGAKSNNENIISSINTYYCALYDPYSKVFDGFTGKDIWVTPVYHMAQQIPTNDKLYDIWYPSAGLNRGSLTDIKDLRYNCNQTDRDNFYLNQINPIVNFDLGGNVIWGNLTSQRKASSLQDIHAIRTVLYIKRALEQYCKYYVFEFNDQTAWDAVKNDIDPFLEKIRKARGLTDYGVEVGATEYELKNKTMHVNVNLTPARIIERIELNLYIN